MLKSKFTFRTSVITNFNFRIVCSDGDYICCNETSSTQEPEVTTVVTPNGKLVTVSSTTVENPAIKGETNNTDNCGVPKTQLNVRILTPGDRCSDNYSGGTPLDS
jgi:hypothetical protein